MQAHIDQIKSVDIEYEDTRLIQVLNLPHEATESPEKRRQWHMKQWINIITNISQTAKPTILEELHSCKNSFYSQKII